MKRAMIIQGMSDATAIPTAAAFDGIAPLPHLGILRAQGEDAIAFLQGQLTQDVAHLPVGQGRLAALCTPKGRMRASFIACRSADDELLLITSLDVLPATLKRLSMFVLRARLKLNDASAAFKLRGLMGKTAESVIKKIAESPHPICEQPGFLHAAPLCIPLPPADGAPRTLWLAPADQPAPAGPALAEADWLFAEVRAGVARITAPVAEAFVPQMLNYESVNGVHFKKGCYPGQEVVARSQFRGTIKRRAFVGQTTGTAAAGQEVFSPGDAGQPVGLIAQAAAAPGGGSAVIAALQLAAEAAARQSAQPLRLGSVDGPALAGLHIPYPLAEDI